MSDPYGRVKPRRLTFKGGDLATRSKSIDKKKRKKKKKQNQSSEDAFAVAAEEVFPEEAIGGVVGTSITEEEEVEVEEGSSAAAGVVGEIYTIDAAKRRKYDELFPVEAKKFGYDPKSNVKSVEEALDDRVKKKADRYCK